MEVRLVGSTKNITQQKTAKRWVQNHARICYSEKDWDELLEEGFQKGLVRGLIGRGHHSPFDHFVLNFYLDGPEKSLAMVFNNQGMYTTSEKSARYTVMSGIPKTQRFLYEKWDKWFLEGILRRFPEDEFPKLYFRRKPTEKSTAEKLAQENARYMTSVFTPTKMTHSLTWRQMNIVYHHFQDFIAEHGGGSDEFKSRLASAMQGFVDSKEIRKWVIDEAQVRMKGNIPLKFFRKPLQEVFGEDVYSTNYDSSFASLAQLHRHRLVNYSVSDGFQLGARRGFYIPRLVEAAGKNSEWLRDLESVAESDFPQAQLLYVGERGFPDNLPARTEERECGLAQLETARVVDSLLERYSQYVPSIKKLRIPACVPEGCKKGGCTFGPSKYLERLI
jgi:hypothetical protein